MKRIFALALIAVLTAGLFCGCDGETVPPSDKVTLNVYNWGQYIADGSDGYMDVIAEFEKAYPWINVNYSTYESNEIMYNKLAAGGITVDVIIPSDYMIARMIDEGMLLELNFDNIPNYQHIDDTFKNTAYDPENQYSVPYAWGTVGIIYNSAYVAEEDVTGWELLWNEKYDDKILMFDNSRDAFGIAELMLGYSLNTTDEAELAECAELLARQKPLVQQYVMDQIYDLMQNEEAWIAACYAGDYLVMAEENENLCFYLPEDQGFNLFIDAMCIPACCQEKEAAELFINFLCEPEIAAGNMEWIAYSTPLKQESVADFMDPEMLADPVSYPANEVLALGQSFDSLPAATSRLMESLFLKARIKN